MKWFLFGKGFSEPEVLSFPGHCSAGRAFIREATQEAGLENGVCLKELLAQEWTPFLGEHGVVSYGMFTCNFSIKQVTACVSQQTSFPLESYGWSTLRR